METKKIAVACFIGGALCCAIALMFAPVYWWFGLVAGVAGGYISYEFREVCKAISVASRVASRVAGRRCAGAWGDAIAQAGAFFSESHPILYPATVMAIPLWLWQMCLFVPSQLPAEPNIGSLFGFCVSVVLGGIYSLVGMISVIAILIVILALVGSRREQCYWRRPFLTNVSDAYEKMMINELEEQGLREESLTYRNVNRWIAKGLGVTVLFFILTMWKELAIGALRGLCFLGRFAYHLFKLVHSEKRALCAIDGTLGGVASYFWFASAAASFPGQAALIIFGGLLGAAFGVANWEIVSKRILHVDVVSP